MHERMHVRAASRGPKRPDHPDSPSSWRCSAPA